MQPYVDKDILLEFDEEVRDYLPGIRTGLATLRRDPNHAEAVAEVHRLVHTIRGAAAMIGFDDVSRTAADLEQRLEDASEAKSPLDSRAVHSLAEQVDAIEERLKTALSLLDQTPEEDLPEPPEPGSPFPDVGLFDDPDIVIPASVAPQAETPQPQTGQDPELLREFEDQALQRLDLSARRLREAQFDASRPDALDDVRHAVAALAESAVEVGLPEAAGVAGVMVDALRRCTEHGIHPNDAQFDLFSDTTDLLARMTRERTPGEDIQGQAAKIRAAYADAFQPADDVARLAAAVEEPPFEEPSLSDLDVVEPSVDDLPLNGDAPAEPSFDDLADLDAPAAEADVEPPSLEPDLLDAASLLDQAEPPAVDFGDEPSAPEETPPAEPAPAPSVDVSFDEELLETFREEAEEHLASVAENLQALDEDPAQIERAREVRRSFHTIKGAAAMVGIQPPSDLARRCEELLDAVYERGLALTPEILVLMGRSTEVLAELSAGNAGDELEARLSVLNADLAAASATLDEQAAAPEPAEDPFAAVDDPADPEPEPIPEPELDLPADSAVSAELLETFQEEAEEHLASVAEHLRALEQDPAQPERIQEVRRSVHTIKGAAGMVGLTTAAQLAHHCEDLLDRIYEDERPLTPEVIGLLYRATDALEDLSKGQEAAGDLLARVEAVHADVERQMAALETTADEPFVEAEASPDEVPSERPPLAAAEPASEPEAPADIDGFSAELLETFQEEAEENLAMIAEHLRALESDPNQPERVQEVRRGVHTLKGAAGMVGLQQASSLAHHCEDLLDRIYEGDALITASTISLLFSASDALEDLAKAAPHSPEIEERLNALHARVDQELAGLDGDAETSLDETHEAEAEVEETEEALPAPPVELVDPVASAPELAPEPQPAPEPEPLEQPPLPDLLHAAMAEASAAPVQRQKPARSTQYVRVSLDRIEELIKLVSELLVNRSALDQHYSQYTREVGEMGLSVDRLRRLTTKLETEYTTGQLLDSNSLRRAEVPRLTPGVATSSAKEFDELEFDRYTEFHLVSRDMTETSVDLASANTSLRAVAGNFHASILRINRLTSEMQDKLMRLSMSPFAAVENRLHRTVRVTADKRGRAVDFHLEGADVELDKGILEDIVAPLEHLLRNAVDHGIEPPEERRAAGKHDRGVITIRVILEGSQVTIEVRDDGRGLDPEKLKRKAVQRGLYSEADVEQLGKRELYSLLFQPGFSTAAEVSDISGRGVGLDVVRSTVLALNGSVSIESDLGYGTTFLIRLPTTLAVTRVLVVEANEQTFAVPTHAVEQVLRFAPTEFIKAHGKTWVLHDGRRIEVVGLADALGLPGNPSIDGDKTPLLAVDNGDRLFALAVDKILEGQEVVVKTLGGLLRRVHGIAGATTRGDGSVMLILSAAELCSRRNAPPSRSVEESITRKPLVLVADDSLSVRRVLTKVLSANGFDMLVAKDGAEAVELLDSAKHRPDALLLDVEMPRMDGYEVVSTVRGRPELAQTPIVMLTSRAGEKHRKKAFDLGANDYLVKPFQQEKLLSTLRGVITAARAARA